MMVRAKVVRCQLYTGSLVISPQFHRIMKSPLLCYEILNTRVSAFQRVYNLAVEIRLTVILGLAKITSTFWEEIFCAKCPKNVPVLKVQGWILWVGNEREQRKCSEKKQCLSWALKGTSRQNRHRDEKLPIKYGKKEIGHLGQIMLRQ